MRRVIGALFSGILFPLLYFCVQMFTSQAVMLSYVNGWVTQNPTGTDAQLQADWEIFYQGVGAWILGAAALLTLLLLLFLLRRAPGGLTGQVGVAVPSPPAIGLLAVCGVAALLALLSLLTLLPIPEAVSRSHSETVELMNGAGLAANLICGCLLAPVAEEVVFRGMSLRLLRMALSPRVSILISSVIFALFHGDVMQVFYTLPLGLLLGLCYHWFNSIWAPILTHVAFNAGNYLLGALLPEQMSREQMGLFVALGAVVTAVGLYGLHRLSRRERKASKDGWTFFSGEK